MSPRNNQLKKLPMQELMKADVLIIGSGIAGCTAALTLADADIHVLVVSRTPDLSETNTRYAQGGIIYRGVEDSAQKLAADILNAGDGHCLPEAVNLLAAEGPGAVQRLLLQRCKVPFDHDENGQMSLALEGGHSLPRIIHAADVTGRAIQAKIIAAVQQHPNISLLANCTAIELLTPAHNSRDRLSVYQTERCIGAYLLDRDSGKVLRCMSRKTVLASGGLGQIFLRTTNPAGVRGDGLAMAYRAGARVINAEFVQFHPTAFFANDAAHFLISEAVRGAGARLVNSSGQAFMDKYDPQWKDLAPRDKVARSIHLEMLQSGFPNVYLDLKSYIPRAKILGHFPTIAERCQQYDIDITEDPVPVVPAAHYSCGGIWTDLQGRTTLQQLYAIGEVACTGVHGANRLASTSLLEGLVWGERAAQDIINTLPDERYYPQKDIPEWHYSGDIPADPALVQQDMSAIKHIMWNYVGLVRSRQRLARALRDLRQLETEIEQFYRSSQLNDSLIGLRNAIRVALIVAGAAWQNKRCVGCHFRED